MDAREIEQIGPYPVKRMIAEGGMSWVFEVEDPRFGVRRALKMLKRGIAEGLDERFQAEVRTLAHVEHPNVITIYDFGTDEALGCDYYTMTFVDGSTLAEQKNLTPRQAGRIFLDVLMGLGQLHDKGVTHRDLKPSNVVLTPDGRAVLIDLGIVHLENEPARTAPGVAMGTVLYMSPEQALGKKVGPTSDVFAAGLSLYQLLAGKSVYENIPELETRTGQAVLMYLGSLHHAGRELEIVFPSHVPPAMRAVIERACRMQPEDRYANAREMHAALEEALREEDADQTHMMSSVDVKRVSGETGGSKTGRRAVVAAGAAVVLLGAAALAWVASERGWWPVPGAVPRETAASEPRSLPREVPSEPEASAFESALEALLTTPGTWSDLHVRFWIEPNPVEVGDPYSVFLSADCDCWPLLFSIDDAEHEITMLFPNRLEDDRRLGRGVVQIPTPPDPIFGGGGGVLSEGEPGTHLLKLLLISGDVVSQIPRPSLGPDDLMWSVRPGQGTRIAELETLLDSLAGVRFASRTARLEAVPRPGVAPTASTPNHASTSEGS